MNKKHLQIGSVVILAVAVFFYLYGGFGSRLGFTPNSADVEIVVLEDLEPSDEWFSLVASIGYTNDGRHYEYIPNLTIYTGASVGSPSGIFNKFLRQPAHEKEYRFVRSFQTSQYPNGVHRPYDSYDNRGSDRLPLESKKGYVLDYTVGRGKGGSTGNRKEISLTLDGKELATFNTRDSLNSQYLGAGIIRQVGFLKDETTPVFHVEQGYDAGTDSQLRIDVDGDMFDSIGATFQKGVVTIGDQSGPLLYDIGPLVIGNDYVEYLALDPHNYDLVRVTQRLK